MARISKSEVVPQQMNEKFDAVVALIDKCCNERLNEEYAKLARQLTAALCRKRPSPLLNGRINTWACGVVYALGFVNFLFDKSSEPYMNATELCKCFGISKSTGSAKSKEIRDIFNMIQMDPNWCLPSEMNNNPMAWTIMLDGFIVDVRTVPKHIQEMAYQKGLIPYIPNTENGLPKTREEGLISEVTAGNDIGTVKSLLNQGVDVNVKDKNGVTALMCAAEEGNHEIAKLLIKKGADVNAKDKDGETALMWAAEEGNQDIVKLLLDQGADVHVKDKIGDTTLIYAADCGHLEIVKLLLEKGSNVNEKNKDGETALIWAVTEDNPDLVKLLIKNGADVNAKTNDGGTALVWATANGYIQIAALLKKHGAKE